MEFGEWVLLKRKEQGLDIESFAEKTHVNVGTISRIENGHTQPTIYTAYRLTEGLNKTVSILLEDLGLPYKQSADKSALDGKNVLTLHDVEDFIHAFYATPTIARSYLTHLLNNLYRTHKNRFEEERSPNVEDNIHKPPNNNFFRDEDIDKLLSSSLLYHFDLKYPPLAGLKRSTLRTTYYSQGAIINNDIEHFMAGLRAFATRLSKSSKNFLERIALGSGSFDRVKLSEILAIEKELSLNGELLGIFWAACKFDETFNSPTIRSKFIQKDSFDDMREDSIDDDGHLSDHSPTQRSVYKIATSYVIIYRWYQYLFDTGNPIPFEKYF